MKELYADDGIKMINVRHTNPAVIEFPERSVEPVWRIRRKRNLAIRGIEVAVAVSLGLNILQSIVIYILQAGPV